jgi:hypothetical protein
MEFSEEVTSVEFRVFFVYTISGVKPYRKSQNFVLLKTEVEFKNINFAYLKAQSHEKVCEIMTKDGKMGLY